MFHQKSVDTWKNKQGQITGFIHPQGFGEKSCRSIGECNNNWTLKPGSIAAMSDEAEETLQVSIDGDSWRDLN